MKWILKKGTILFIGVFICLFASCVKPPPLPEFSEPPPEPPVFPFPVELDPLDPLGTVVIGTSLKTVSEDWNTYKASRVEKGYTLRSVEGSEAWLKANAIQLDIDVDSNSQFNLRPVVTYKTQTGTRVDTMLIVNDDVGNQRVFEKY